MSLDATVIYYAKIYKAWHEACETMLGFVMLLVELREQEFLSATRTDNTFRSARCH